MKLYFMKQKVIDDLKENMLTLHPNYYKFNTNEWILERYDYDPFEFFMEVPDFELSMLDSRNIGEIELENCKILYEHFKKISESQASDERLWAGLCNGVFYQYVRERWKYPTLKQKKPETDASAIISRFFFSGGGRAGIFRNTLAKCWWAGQSTYDSMNSKHWEMLDSIGPEDFATKVSDILYSNTFAANTDIMKGICKGLNFYRKQGIGLSVKDHIRPTMQYLNALGGSVLLDMYTEDEIAKEVINFIERSRTGKESAFVVEEIQEVPEDNIIDDESDAIQMDEVNIDYQEYEDAQIAATEELDPKTILGAPDSVIYGCKVVVKDVVSGKYMEPVIPKEVGVGQLYPLPEKLLGHSVGDVVVHMGKRYEVIKIEWA